MFIANRSVSNRENVHGSLRAIGVLHRVETCRGRVSRRNQAAGWTRGRPCWQSGRTARSGWRSSRVCVFWWWRRRWCLCTVLGSNCSRFRFSCQAPLCDTKRRLGVSVCIVIAWKYYSIASRKQLSYYNNIHEFIIAKREMYEQKNIDSLLLFQEKHSDLR